MVQVGIASVGTSVPSKILTNFDLEKMVETSDEWIVSRTGIKERHILSEDEKIYTFVAEAAKIACEKSNLPGEKIDFVISSTISPDRISPAQSFEVARELKANHAFCFDLNAACSGFIFGLAAAEGFLKTRPVSHGVVTAGEQLTRTTNYSDRNSCVLFGDAASAVVVTNDHPEHLLLTTELGADPTMSEEVIIGGINDLLTNHRENYYFRQNGKAVFKFAVNKIKELLDTVPRKVGLKPEQIRYVVPHQANLRIIEAAAEANQGKTEFINIIDKYGNTSSSSVGLALESGWGKFQKGDYIMLIAFGGGLSWGAALLQW